MTVSYPGVYIQEVSSGVHTITSVGTSITAFVDFFREGPMDEPVEIFGMSDFARNYGGLDTRSEASYAIAQFFLNGGTSALVVRCGSEDLGNPLRAASVGIRGTGLAGAALVTIDAVSPGAWGNTLRVEIDDDTTDPLRTFNLTATRFSSTQPDAGPLVTERHLNVSLDAASPRNIISVLRDNSQLVRAQIPALTVAVPAPCGSISPPIVLTQTQLNALGTGTKQFRVRYDGDWYVATLPNWPTGAVSAATRATQLAPRVEMAIRSATLAGVATPEALTSATVRGTDTDQLYIVAGRGDPFLNFTFSDNGADTTATALQLSAGSDNVQRYQLGSATGTTLGYVAGQVGGDGLPPSADALAGAAAKATGKGIFALNRVDLFNILCLPRAVASTMPNGLTDAQATLVVGEAIAYCALKRAFFLLDIPETIDEVTEIKQWLDAPAHSTFRHRNVAVFFPRTKVVDPLNEYRPRSLAASGTMAGIFARTDAERGVFKAPAGLEAALRGVQEVTLGPIGGSQTAVPRNLTDAENGVLNPLGINCLRQFPIYGMVSWGARTLMGADALGDEWKYIPVRRLALMLEESLFRGTKWVVFEPNDEPLWANIRLNLNAYMTSLFRQGAFQGGTPREAFYVKCDKETTTQDDRNKGIVNIEVGFAPLKPAEFVVIKIQQMRGDL